jgi:hypothetical protein
MAAAFFAAGDQDTIGAFLEGFHKIIYLEPTGARRPDNAHVGRVLQA